MDKFEEISKDIANFALGSYVLGDGDIADIDFPEIMKKLGVEHFNTWDKIKDFVKRRLQEEFNGQG